MYLVKIMRYLLSLTIFAITAGFYYLFAWIVTKLPWMQPIDFYQALAFVAIVALASKTADEAMEKFDAKKY